MHIACLEPTRGESLRAEAGIVRSSSNIGTVNIDATDRET
ncbi:MAG: hypothetical protein ACI9EZ_000471 [Halobacteriales archaeon]|jgi:hypothetical protein